MPARQIRSATSLTGPGREILSESPSSSASFMSFFRSTPSPYIVSRYSGKRSAVFAKARMIISWFLLASTRPTATISFSRGPSKGCLTKSGFSGFFRTTAFFRTLSGKNAFARSDWRITPAAFLNKVFERMRSGLEAYSSFGSPRTDTATGIPKKAEVRRAMILFFPMKERITSGRSFFQMPRSFFRRAKKLPIRLLFVSSCVISLNIRRTPSGSGYSTSPWYWVTMVTRHP